MDELLWKKRSALYRSGPYSSQHLGYSLNWLISICFLGVCAKGVFKKSDITELKSKFRALSYVHERETPAGLHLHSRAGRYEMDLSSQKVLDNADDQGRTYQTRLIRQSMKKIKAMLRKMRPNLPVNV
ncbi:hypothetical protein RHMOL_Rhmol04G0013900 [Rhododendron molle]|nr:hypothetical protein RHMOL_Rhmol04G0013900 [Rhododendron molle]